MRKFQALALVVLSLGLALSAGAAPTNHYYGNFNGTNFDFLSTNETVQTADDDPNPLFEAPIVAGDQLIFSPSSFDADSSGGVGGIDTSHSTFNATITGKNGAFVDLISIDEAGDILLTAFPPGSGTLATGVIATLSGTVTILDAVNTSLIGQQITFGGLGADFDTTFLAGGPPLTNQLFIGLPNTAVSWTGSVDIDIASLFSGVKSVELQLNNILQANSEVGTTSLIQKKTVTGPTITVIPEPGTAALLACGLLAMAARARIRRF